MIASSTLQFLLDVAENNNRDWFNENRKVYEATKKDIESVVAELIAGMVKHEPEFAGLEAKKSMFRIFRDARFSANKAPYKTNMGAWMARGGRKSPFAGFYLHIQPGASFLAGGVYHPESKILKGIREGIDYDAQSLRDIITNKAFVNRFEEMTGDKVKTSPKGYSKDHPAIDLLRHKSFLMSVNVSDEELTHSDFVSNALDIFADMVPLNQYLNRAIAEVVE